MQQCFQSQGRSDLPSEKWVRPGAAIQLPILCLSRWTRLECASTRKEMPSWSACVCNRSGQVAETRPLRSGIYPKNRCHPRRTTICEDQKNRMAPWNTTPNIVRRCSTRRSDATGKNGRRSYFFLFLIRYCSRLYEEYRKMREGRHIMWTRIYLIFFPGIQGILDVHPTIFISLSRPEELNCEDGSARKIVVNCAYSICVSIKLFVTVTI